MAPLIRQGLLWKLVDDQHGVVSRRQLRDHGLSAEAIRHRIARGRLHPIHRGVYAVGRREIGDLGRAMAAVLACGPSALICGASAAWLMRITENSPGLIHVSVTGTTRREHDGICIHRRSADLALDRRDHHNVPLVEPFWVLVELAGELDDTDLERAINQADFHDLIRVPELRRRAEEHRPYPGTARLAGLVDRRTFRLTDSVLEQKFKPLARRAGLAAPDTRIFLDGFRVDFYFHDLDLVVETDSFGAHRTPAQLTRDAERLQAHTGAGRSMLRFSHAQVAYEPERVVEILRRTAAGIAARRSSLSV